MKKQQQAWQRETHEVERLAYTPPRLKEFGPVGALTQGGSGDMVEGAMGMGMMGGSNNPNRRP